MKNNILKKVWPVLFLGLICLIGIKIGNENSVNAANDYLGFYVGGTTYKDKSSIDLSSQTTTPILLSISQEAGFSKDCTVVWESSNPEIVSIASSSGLSTTVTRKNPGSATIAATVTDNASGKIYNISCSVKYDFEVIVDQTSGWNSEKKFIFDDLNATTATKNVKVYYKDTTVAIPTAKIYAESSDSSIVSVSTDGDKVTITRVGAGEAQITLKAVTDIGDLIEDKVFNVLVAPGLKLSSADSFVNALGTDASPIVATSNTMSFITNAKISKNLTWKAYAKSGSTWVTTNLVEITPSGYGDKCRVDFNKAGTYKIYAMTSDGNIADATNEEYAVAIIKVPLFFDGSTNVVMNIGDTYDIFENTNATSKGSLSYTKVSGKTGENYSAINLNTSTGLVKAQEKGTITVKITNNDPNVSTPGNVPMEITFTVIDSIALSMTEASVYKGSSITLDVMVTDETKPITWTSSDESIATVDGGTVTGVKPGIVTITASQTINGVIKSAVCYLTVKDGVTQITLDPSETTLGINNFLTIYALTTPEDAKDVKLKWVSSNPNIVKIVDTTDTKGRTITVQGVAGGVAVISAIDANSVVVGSCKITVKEAVKSITLSETEITTDLKTSRIQLRATIEPNNAFDKSVFWESSDPKVATVDQNGLVTVLTSGKVTIIASSVDNPKLKAMCNITVNVPVSSLTLDSKTKIIEIGKSERITYTIAPKNATNNTIIWTSTDQSVATVDATGNVTAKAVGQTTIIAKTIDGGIIQYCTVYVSSPSKEISLDKTKLTLKVGEYYYLIAKLSPEDTTEKNVTFESLNPEVATVTAAGKVEGKSGGTAIIIAKDSSGHMVYCNVEVIDSVTGLTLNYSKKTIAKGKTFKLVANVIPSTASNKEVTWTSSNTKVATIDKNGTIKGIAGGTTVITCKTKDGNYAAVCIVTVKESVTSITLNKKSYKLGVGKSFTLKATVKNSTATNKGVYWKSSNTKVATVNSKGKVTAKRLGYATITAVAKDGSGVEASCNIRVVVPVSSIKLNKTAITLVEGRTTKLKATVRPAKATYKTGKWTSSNTKVAVVSSNGTITALSEGTAIIKFTAKDDSGKSASCFVNVIKYVPATSVTILNPDTIMVVGETSILQRTISPATASDKAKWFTDNSSVVTINKNTGKIKAIRPGIANITVAAGTKSANIKVTVVGLNRTTLTLTQYEKYRLRVEGVTTGVTWTVDNPAIAVISNSGEIGTRAPGTTTVTATVNGKKLRCRLRVTEIK